MPELTVEVPVGEHRGRTKSEYVRDIEETCRLSIQSVQQDLEKVNQLILAIIRSDERLNHLFDIITSVDGVGKMLATTLLIYTNEFKNFSSAKKFACYCGIATFEYSSGTSLRGKSKTSKLANIRMKAILHMPALSSIRMRGIYGHIFAGKWLRAIQK